MTTPKLAQGLEVVTIPNGIAVINAGHPVLFQGRAANEILLPLLNALDGSRDAAELAAQLGLSIAHVERGVELLAERRLLAAD